MCMVYFLGCDFNAPLSPRWAEKKPAFYIGIPSQDEIDRVRTKLPHTHIRYLGSHEGCGCGFRSELNGYLVQREGEEAQVEAADHAALVAYLKALPREGRPAQIFGCWNGDETEAIAHQRECAIEELAAPEFAFRERELITLRS
jgi:hypothetical protein